MAAPDPDRSSSSIAAAVNAGGTVAVPRLRILHTVSSLCYGGMENFVLRIASKQKERGHDVAILALRGGPLLPRAMEAGLKVESVGNMTRTVRFARGIRFITTYRPDIIHAHNSTSLHYAAYGKFCSGAKLVFTDHGAWIVRRPSGWEFRAADAAIAVSGQTAESRRDAYGFPQEFGVIQNGVTFEPAMRPREAVRRQLDLSAPLVAIIVARLDPVKDHEMLLRALAALNPDSTPISLIVAGDGGERPRLEALSIQLGLGAERIRFVGFRSDIPDLLEAADLFVLSSRDEGLPLAMLEAMSHGLPVVSTSVGGVPEVLSHGVNGLLVPSGDSSAMAEAVGLIARDGQLRARLGQAGRRRVESEFSFERTFRQYEDLYYRIRS